MPVSQSTASNLLNQDASDGPVSAGTAAGKSSLGGLVAATSAPTPTNGQQIALQGDTNGNLRVNRFGQTGSIASKSFTGGVGGAAQAYSITVPAATKWILRSVIAALQTNGTVANRVLFLQIQDASGNTLGNFPSSYVQTATQGPFNYTWGSGLPSSTSLISGTNLLSPMPADIPLGPGMKVLIVEVGGNSGDTVGTTWILVEQYPD